MFLYFKDSFLSIFSFEPDEIRVQFLGEDVIRCHTFADPKISSVIRQIRIFLTSLLLIRYNGAEGDTRTQTVRQ